MQSFCLLNCQTIIKDPFLVSFTPGKRSRKAYIGDTVQLPGLPMVDGRFQIVCRANFFHMCLCISRLTRNHFPSLASLSICLSLCSSHLNVLLKQPLLVSLRSDLLFSFRRTLTSYQKVGAGLARMTRIPEIPVPGRFLRSNISTSSNSFQRNLSKSILTDWPCQHCQIGKLQSLIGILFTFLLCPHIE